MNKFEKEYEVTGQVNVKNIWNLYENVSNWSMWDKSLKNVTLEGDFVDNTKGTMFFAMDNMSPLQFVLSDVEVNKRFVLISSLNGIEVKIDHLITCQNSEYCTIKHIVTVEGETEKMVQGIGAGLTSKLDVFLENLISIAKKDKCYAV